MPKVEDFSPVVKAEMDRRAQPVQHVPEERGPMGLLKRITNSLGRREEEEPAHVEPAAPAPQQRRPLSAEASLYAPRRGNLDDHGRAVPQAHHEEDQLEIPAFLRRQSN
jgi:cell division protein FtsZ